MKSQKKFEFNNQDVAPVAQSTTNLDDVVTKLMKPDKTFRDAVHGDIMLTDLEVKIIDTAAFQRLRGIRQLGTAHLVYTCANHTRFDHAIGCVFMAEKIITIINNSFFSLIKINPYERFLIRLCGLLHDLAHVPFGHTIEDEAGLFKDDNGKTLSQWKDNDRVNKFLGDASDVANVITNDKLLIELGKEKDYSEFKPENLLEDLKLHLKAIEFHNADSLKKPFIADIIGDTLCADLLDYVRRDIYFTGLQENYDDRFLSYLYITKVEKKPRIVLRLHKPSNQRIRRDVMSEMIHLLRLRYSLSEKVYYHHSKIASSAMIISAMTSIFYEHKTLDRKFLFDMSDSDVLAFMKKSEYATNASKFLMQKLESRKIHKPIYGLKFSEETYGNKEKRDNIRSMLTDKEKRYNLERYLESVHELPKGSIVIYCPKQGMGAKAAEVLVDLGNNKIGPLFSLDKSAKKSMAYGLIYDEIDVSIIKKHQELWSMYVFIAEEFANKENKEKNIKMLQNLNGDCENIFDIKNELEECQEFYVSNHNHRYDRFEEKLVKENKSLVKLDHDMIHSLAFRSNDDSDYITYEDYKLIRQNEAIN